MKATKKEEKALDECFRRLYNNSEPKGDWSTLKNRSDDYFLKYEIDYGLMEVILDNIIREFKIKPKYRAQAFKTTVYLGPSPKYSTNPFD